MALIFSWQTDTLLLSSILCLVLYMYMKRNFNYWKRQRVYGPEPVAFIGNAWEIVSGRKHVGQWLKDIYDTKPNEPFIGIFVFDQPLLILKSPEIIKQILVRDFKYFEDHNVFSPEHNEVLSNFIAFQKGSFWKETRSKVSPAFSTAKIKSMFPVISNVGGHFKIYLEKHESSLDAKEVCCKFVIDSLAQVLFGINSHCLDTEDAKFRGIGHDMFAFTTRNALAQTSYFFKPDLARWLKLNFFEEHIIDFFREAFWKSVNSRQNLRTNKYCLVDILSELRKQDPMFDGDKMVGHAVQFFAAGFDTTTSAIAYSLYEMCLNNGIQDKLRTEIKTTVENHGGLVYEGLNEMKYLDMCVAETLRKYPVLPFVDRCCNADYKIPGTDVMIKKGVSVFVSLLGLHNDPKHFPDPEKYIPERFTENFNAEKLVHIPFGYGPRACIGERLGLLIAKLGIIHVINNFVVEKDPEMPVPIVFEAKAFSLQSKFGLPIKFKPFSPTVLNN